MRSVLLLIGAISMAMANPFPTAQFDSEGHDDVEASAGQEGPDNEYPFEVFDNDDQVLGQTPAGSNDRFAYAGAGEETTMGSYYNIHPDNVIEYDLAKDSMSASDREFNSFQCGHQSSVCCIDQAITPVTQDFLCETSIFAFLASICVQLMFPVQSPLWLRVFLLCALTRNTSPHAKGTWPF